MHRTRTTVARFRVHNTADGNEMCFHCCAAAASGDMFGAGGAGVATCCLGSGESAVRTLAGRGVHDPRQRRLWGHFGPNAQGVNIVRNRSADHLVLNVSTELEQLIAA